MTGVTEVTDLTLLPFRERAHVIMCKRERRTGTVTCVTCVGAGSGLLQPAKVDPLHGAQAPMQTAKLSHCSASHPASLVWRNRIYTYPASTEGASAPPRGSQACSWFLPGEM